MPSTALLLALDLPFVVTPLFLAATLVLGVFLLRRAYQPGEATRGQVAQELCGCLLATLGVIFTIASVGR